MKQFSSLLLVAFLLCGVNSYAQKKRIYLFQDFTQGTILMKDKSKVSVPVNYDASNRKMMYIDKNETMILSGLEVIDTVYIDSHKFVPVGRNTFLEVISVPNGTIYINWLLKQQTQGKKGAYGQTIQGSVENVDLNYLRQQAGDTERKSADVYSSYNENEYWFFQSGKPVKFKNKKSLLKLFPGKEISIDNFVKENKINMSDPESVIKLTDYCLGL